jgi:hypothetical protein
MGTEPRRPTREWYRRRPLDHSPRRRGRTTRACTCPSLYEPPGSEPSSGYVSPGCSDDPDLEPEAETPSPAVTHAGSDTE